METDALFLSAILQEKQPGLLKGLKPEFFMPEWLPVFKFISEFTTSHGKLPKLFTVKNKFRDLGIPVAQEPVAFYAKELKTRYALNLMDDILHTKYTQQRSLNDVDGSVAALKAAVLAVERNRVEGKGGVLQINQGTLLRRKAYLRRKTAKGLLGIKTPWATLNSVTQGWQPGDLAVFLARAGRGKTFLVLLNALAAMREKKNVLVASMEMLPERLGVRVDALGAGISVEKFRKGALSIKEFHALNKWYRRLRKLKEWGRVDLFGPSEISSPLDLELNIQLGKYDLAIWDSFYLAAKHKKWEEFAQLIADVKKVATRTKTPILITSQFNKEVRETHTSADQASAAFSDSILHDADFVFALFQTPTMKVLHEMLMRSLKVREGIELSELLLRWDIDRGDFAELSSSLPEMVKANDPLNQEVPLDYEYN